MWVGVNIFVDYTILVVHTDIRGMYCVESHVCVHEIDPLENYNGNFEKEIEIKKLIYTRAKEGGKKMKNVYIT